MNQLFQDLSTGSTLTITSPAPVYADTSLLIATRKTLISTGTERMLVDFGKASYLAKARQQPEKVKQVLNKIMTDGLFNTFEAVKAKLNEPLPLGYCNVGSVLEVGKNISGFVSGDRVLSNGPHAEIITIGKNLCVRIPDAVEDEDAVFAIPASIGLQGLRLAKPEVGEAFVVIGVGLIGLLVVQLLQANGCRVLAMDYDKGKLELAALFGAETYQLSDESEPVAKGLAFSYGRGVDGVIVTAATASNDPISNAAKMLRKRGRIVLVGVTGLNLNRADFYEKEISFQVSCSYGPGRYENSYEKKGLDYPIGFVRWTEQRNFEAVLDLMAQGKLNTKPLITHRFAFEKAEDAYKVLSEDKSALGIILSYDSDITARLHKEVILNERPSPGGQTLANNCASASPHPPCGHLLPMSGEKVSKISKNKPVIGMLGAGNYSARVLIPVLKSLNANLHTLVTATGTKAAIYGKKAGFLRAASDVDMLIASSDINTIVIATPHNTHAKLVNMALKARKNVFVEKPLALTLDEVDEIAETIRFLQTSDHVMPCLMVGFNRRFAPQIIKMRELLNKISAPKSFIMTMNAGFIPQNHWTQDISVGGGRIVGEACHYIDLMRYLADSRIQSLETKIMPGSHDTATINLGFEDGSIGSIHYFANGSPRFAKERIEVFAAGRVLQLDNFRQLQGYGFKGFSKMNLWRQDKGQKQCISAFLNAIEQGAKPPIPLEEIFEVARNSIKAAALCQERDKKIELSTI